MEPALAPKGDLREVIEKQVTIPRDNFVPGLPDRSRLLFAYEMGVFSLHCVRNFAEYRKIYNQAQARHRHTHKGITSPDLFPPEEKDVCKRAEWAAVLGRALQLFEEETDPETQDRALYYYLLLPGPSWPASHTAGAGLAGGRRAVVPKPKGKGDPRLQPGRHAAGEIGRAPPANGKDAKTRPQKERLWRLVQDYLDAREGELEGGLRHMKQAWTNTVISPAEHQELDAQI
jgi:hypothetical protein